VSSIEDRGHTDAVTTPTRAGLRLSAAAADDVTTETYYYGHRSILTVTLDLDLDL